MIRQSAIPIGSRRESNWVTDEPGAPVILMGMSKRTWACVECGTVYRRETDGSSVRCADCGQTCESLPWKVRLPSPKKQKQWTNFWNDYHAEVAEYEAWQAGTLNGPIHQHIHNRLLAKRA